MSNDRVEHKGEVYVSVLSEDCKGCAFQVLTTDCMEFPGYCGSAARDDGQNVIWVKAAEYHVERS
jgi:hypothetical protein